MKLSRPKNISQLSKAAFEFGHRDKQWSFTLDAFEDVRVQEYWSKDFSEGVEESINLFKGDCDSFSSFEHFVASVSVLQFEDSYPIRQHLDELEKIELCARSHSEFSTEWLAYSRMLKRPPPCPKVFGEAYQSRNEFNWVFWFAQSDHQYFAFEWGTSG